MPESTLFALALDRMDGVGRVTAGRLLDHFTTYEDLLRYPREQVLARIRGVAKAEALVARLFDQAAMQVLLEEAQQELDRLAERRLGVLSPHDTSWPAGFDALPRNHRPFLLYTYGAQVILQQKTVAYFAQPPVAPSAFEMAQALVQHLLPHGVSPATGTTNGFDVVMHKLCYAGASTYPSLLVSGTGMAKIAPPLRPTVSAVVRGGGLLCSPFPLNHGPFDHDEKERTLTLAALVQACAFFEPQPNTPEWLAMTWALDAGRPVFGIAHTEHPLPPAVHQLRTLDDFDWVLAAIQTVRGKINL